MTMEISRKLFSTGNEQDKSSELDKLYENI